jgi:spermidine/putrescine transport system ATP-binding protein
MMAMTDSFGVELRDITKRFGEVTAVDDLELQIRDGEFFSLIGPSGCGKTTTLRMIAGFEQPTEGEITINGRPVAGTPPYQRPVNTVFQNYALFPHMTVAENIAFGLEMSRVGRPEIRRRVEEVLALVRLPQMAGRKPKQLSGGQQQRVALARALVNRPQVLLLDEPLGALDLKLRKEMQLELKHIQSEVGITFIYVTHDQEEAMAMSDRIGIMSHGVLQQVGTPREVYEHPTNRFVADFIGETNFINGSVTSLGRHPTVCLCLVGDVPVLGMVGTVGTADESPLDVGQEITLAIRPERINLYPQGRTDVIKAEMGQKAEEIRQMLGGNIPDAVDVREWLALESDNVVLEGVVREATYIGTDTRYLVQLEGGTCVFVRQQNYGARYDTLFNVGNVVYVHWAAENAQVLVD